MSATLGMETTVPLEILALAVERFFARCDRSEDGCLVLRGESYGDGRKRTPQICVQLVPGYRITLQAARVVYLVKNDGPAPQSHHVRRTCERSRCFEPTHLKAFRPNMDLGLKAKANLLEANRRGGVLRRKYSDKQVERLRQLVARGKSIKAAARTVGIPESTAHQIFAGYRYREGTPKPKRGDYWKPRCSRCGAIGHYRDRGCPAQEVARG